ncbi:MAG TPA: methyltransferase [Candidatus Binatia bacterium]|nr:methyltransferase [Candidatus Binatia bacterium]
MSENWYGIPGDLPPQMELHTLISGKWAMQAVYAAAELGIADQLKDGPRSSAEVARRCDTNEDATYRLMRALSNVGVLDERDGRVFALTDVGQFLRSDVPGSLRGYARFVGYAPSWRAWGEILHSVRTGEPAADHVFGENLFEYFAKHLDESAIFDAAMTSVSGVESEAVATSYDFSAIGTLADVGGGRGFLLATILRRNPAMKGILFDLPHVASGAPSLLREQGVEGRVRIETGSFLETVPMGADAIIMKHIIHDWNDDDCVRILRNCRAALPPRGRLLVVEAVVPPPGQRDWSKLLDLEMLVLTPRGRERTEAEYAKLLAAGGFRLTRVVRTPSPASVVEGERA